MGGDSVSRKQVIVCQSCHNELADCVCEDRKERIGQAILMLMARFPEDTYKQVEKQLGPDATKDLFAMGGFK